MTRTSWHDYWMSMARTVSTRATCPRKQVGAVVVRDNRMLACGYNGAVSGEPHCVDVGCDMEGGHCVRAVHAEVNGVCSAARHGVSLEGSTLFCTLQPCRHCEALLRQAGVVEFHYAEKYPPKRDPIEDNPEVFDG